MRSQLVDKAIEGIREMLDRGHYQGYAIRGHAEVLLHYVEHLEEEIRNDVIKGFLRLDSGVVVDRVTGHVFENSSLPSRSYGTVESLIEQARRLAWLLREANIVYHGIQITDNGTNDCLGLIDELMLRALREQYTEFVPGVSLSTLWKDR